MTRTETQYFALLRSALWNTPAVLEDDVDWNAVLQLAQHHATNVLVSGVAMQWEGSNRPSEAMLATMQTAMRNNLLTQMRLRQILVSAVKLLRENGIEPVLLKGFGLASLYPNPSLRQFGDVDIFVGLGKFHEACRLLRALPGCYNWGEVQDIGHHYNIEFGQFPMEVHRVSAETSDDAELAVYAPIEREGLSENLQRIDLDGFEVSIPSKEFAVFFTFYHAWHHFMKEGVGWRQLSDVAMTLHTYHGQLDLEKLRQWLTSMRLMKPWQTFGYLIVECLALPEAEMPFFDASCHRTAQRLYSNIMAAGNFMRQSKHKSRKPKGGMRRKIHAFVGIFVDFFYRARVFPSEAFRELRSALRKALLKNIRKK